MPPISPTDELSPAASATLLAAWSSYDRRQLDEAIRLCGDVCALAPGNAGCHAALGWFLLEGGRMDEAESVLQATIARHPGFGVAHWYLGVLRQRQRRLDDARHSLSDALRLNPSLDEAAVALAWVLHDMGRIDDAAIWARRALSRKPGAEREELLGWLLLRQNRCDEAATLLQSALARQPDRVRLRCHLASALHALRRGEEAVELLRAGLLLSPDDPDLLLALGWLHHGRGQSDAARAVAERLLRLRPDLATAWHLSGVVLDGRGEPLLAERHFAEALARDESLLDASLRRGTMLREAGRADDAVAVLRTALRHAPEHRELLGALALNLMDLERQDEARRIVHRLLANTPKDGLLWLLLAKLATKRNRRGAARRMLRRACRLSPDAPDAWRDTAWAALEDDNPDCARQAIGHVLRLAPDDPRTDIQAAFVFESRGELAAASRHAERAIARLPEEVDSWRALAKVRYREGRLQEAESLLRTAAEIDPGSVDVDRQLGWVLMTAHRFIEAESAFASACGKNADAPAIWREIAEVQRRAGRFPESLASLATAERLLPGETKTTLLRARVLADCGPDTTAEAVSLCSRLLRGRHDMEGAASLLMRLAADGDETARAALRMVERKERARLYRLALERAQGECGNGPLRGLAMLAAADFPDDLGLATAALFAHGLDEANSPDEMARRTRLWARRLSLAAGTAPVVRMAGRHARLRIAYVAAHFHHSLLAPVLAAHDPAEVDVFLYTDAPCEDLGRLGRHVIIHPLRGIDLAESMYANRIDVAIDTVGIHPFLGQIEVLEQFARRVAPVQCAWLGSWAGSGGLFDALIADEASVGLADASLFEEAVVRLPGGHWCWEPPAVSPEPGPPPCADGTAPTFGSSVRGLRLTRRTLRAWATVLARLPGSRLELIGDHGQDWRFRRTFSELLASLGVDPGRVRYHPRRAYASYLAFYRDIDIALDAFPSNGGLCSIDALWMGVPVVTLAGSLPGERQGLSLLTAIGHPEWVAGDDEAYVETALRLAADRSGLVRTRHHLRQDLLHSPLVDGARLARALEHACRRLRAEAAPVADAASAKERSRALADRRFGLWLAKRTRLDFGSRDTEDGSAPDVSVVIVLFSQAGLAWLTLSALADQEGIRFETIVVDNASTDATQDLLRRLDGARVERNAENIGFLLAANQGAAMARGRHILFLNSDAVPQPGALFHAVRRLDADDGVGAVGGRIVLGDGTLQEAGCIAYRDGSTTGYGRGRDPLAPMFCFERDVDFCSGAFLMVRRDVWQRLGGFDAAYAPAYYEDADFCLRVRDAGYRVVYEPRAWISHFEYGSARSDDEAAGLMAQNRERFAATHRARLSARPIAAFGRPERDRWLAQGGRRVLVIDNAVPHMAIGGGLPRARVLLRALHGHAVTFYPLWQGDEEWREVYESIPAWTEVMLNHGADELERFLEKRTGIYDTLLVSRPGNMAFVDALWHRRPELFAGMRLIYDAEAIFALREIGQAAVGGHPLARGEPAKRLAAELALARRASIVLAVSRREAAFFTRAGIGDVRVLMHGMATRRHTPPWEARNGFLFVGALNPDTPNEDGLLWFANEVLPRLKERLADLPPIGIIGDCRSDKIAALAGKDVCLIGRVDDPTPYYDQARVFIAPARFAAGIPIKVVEAACNGLPVVASHLLVRQLGWSTEEELLAACDARSFADAMLRLHCDEALWNAVRDGALRRAWREAAPERFETILRDAVAGKPYRPEA